MAANFQVEIVFFNILGHIAKISQIIWQFFTSDTHRGIVITILITEPPLWWSGLYDRAAFV